MTHRNASHRSASHRLGLTLLTVLVAATTSSTAFAAELKGRFVLAGAAVPVIDPVADPKAKVDFPGVTLVYENLVVDPQSRGIAHIAVYVRTANAPITAAAAKAAEPRAVIDTWFGQFRPRVSGVWVGRQRFVVRNQDPVSHNPNFPVVELGGPLLPPANLNLELTPTQAKLIPQEISCNIHPWMKGYVMVRDNPYFAATGPDGSFSIKHLPEGVELEIQVWHELAGYLNADPRWAKGRFTFKFDGDHDLGVIPVAPQLLRLIKTEEVKPETIIKR